MIKKCTKRSRQQLKPVTHVGLWLMCVSDTLPDCLNSLLLCECVFVWERQWDFSFYGEFFFMGGYQNSEVQLMMSIVGKNPPYSENIFRQRLIQQPCTLAVQR